MKKLLLALILTASNASADNVNLSRLIALDNNQQTIRLNATKDSNGWYQLNTVGTGNTSISVSKNVVTDNNGNTVRLSAFRNNDGTLSLAVNGGGGGTPGGSNGQLQFNSSGAFGGLGISSPLSISGGNLTIDLSGYVQTTRTVAGHALSSNVSIFDADLSHNIDDITSSSGGTATLTWGHEIKGTISASSTIAFATAGNDGDSIGGTIVTSGPITWTLPANVKLSSATNSAIATRTWNTAGVTTFSFTKRGSDYILIDDQPDFTNLFVIGTNTPADIGAAGSGSNSDITQLNNSMIAPFSVGLGLATPPTAFVVGDTSSTTPRGLMSWQASSDAASAHVHARKSRGTFAAPTSVVANDVLGRYVFSGYDGTNFNETAYIRSLAVGTIATNRIPSKMEFWTSTDAAPSVATLALTLNKDQTADFTSSLKIGAGSYITSSGSGGALAASAFTDTTSASNISSGTLGAARLPNPSASTLGGIQSKDCTGTGHVLTIGTDGSVTCSADSGGGSPGGSTTQVQRNNAGAFGGITNATSDGTTLTLTSPKIVTGSNDTNGNPLFSFTPTASAIFGLVLTNAASAGTVDLQSTTPTQATAGIVGTPLKIHASDAVAGSGTAGAVNGGLLTLSAGDAKRLTSGNGNGGAVTINAGNLIGSGSLGIINLQQAGTTMFRLDTTSAFSPVTDNNNDIGDASHRVRNLYTVGIVGTTTNNSAGSGNVGESVSSSIAVGSAVSLTTATAANITSISLTAGDWRVSGNVNFTETTATASARSAGISTTSATVPTDGTESYCGVQSTVTTESNTIALPGKRISLSTTTTVYLVGSATFSAGTVSGFGSISARRVR